MNRLAEVYHRAAQVRRTEGFRALLVKATAFVGYCFLQHRSYYLYAERTADLPPLNEADFMPKTDAFIPKVVSSNAEADELEAQGFEFRSQIPKAREVLDNGAIALCIFVGKELANIGWLATTQAAKDSFGEPPYKVDFANKEAVGSGAWTNPKYRRLGLRVYNRFMFLSVVIEQGIEVRRAALPTNNIPIIKSRASFYHEPYATGRYLRILWWKSWKERPLPSDRGE